MNIEQYKMDKGRKDFIEGQGYGWFCMNVWKEKQIVWDKCWGYNCKNRFRFGNEELKAFYF